VGKNLHKMQRCNQSFVSGWDISQHRSLHRAQKCSLTDGTNVSTNLDDKTKH